MSWCFPSGCGERAGDDGECGFASERAVVVLEDAVVEVAAEIVVGEADGLVLRAVQLRRALGDELVLVRPLLHVLHHDRRVANLVAAADALLTERGVAVRAWALPSAVRTVERSE